MKTFKTMENEFILIISNEKDITTDLVIKRLHERNIGFRRFNTEYFPTNIKSSIHISDSKNGIQLTTEKWTLSENEIKSIWYRRPVLADFSKIAIDDNAKIFAQRETSTYLINMWSSLLNCRWVNDPFAIYKAEKKALQLKIAQEIGFNIPKTIITNSHDDFINFHNSFKGHVIVKPISHGGYGDNDEFAIFTIDLSKKSFDSKTNGIQSSPFILQEKINKTTDVRLTVFGNDIFAYKIDPINQDNPSLDWRKYKPNELRYERIAPPKNIKSSIYKFMNYFNLKFGAFDFCISGDGEWFFLEINPNGQFGWLEIQTGDKLIDSLIKLLNANEN